MMRTLLALLLLSSGTAGEIEATIVRVIDGDSIVVRRTGAVEDEHVRLLYIDCPEVRNNPHGQAMDEGKAAAALVAKLCPAGSTVRMQTGGKDFFDRTLALVMLGRHGPDCLNEEIIKAGWSVYWRKYGVAAGGLGSMDAKLASAHDQAKRTNAGAWKTAPQWMANKANERTAP